MPTQNGTPGNDTLTGTSGSDILNGLGGDDILDGADGNDSLFGGDDNDHLYGGAGSGIDDLDGGAGDDVLDAGVNGYAAGFNDPQEHLYGGAGNDIMMGGGGQAMYGGTGDDTYFVNTARGAIGDFDYIIPEDRVFENDGEGTDTIRSTLGAFTITDSQSIEILILEPQTSPIPRQLGGNSFANTLIGNDSVNALEGHGGNDFIYGNGGNDDLDGGDGDDYLIGGTGADRMQGKEGSDTYYVDDAGDTVIEPVAVGNDRIATSISYTLAADADIEVFEAINSTATNAMDLTGNDFGQTIAGNNGVNHIDGKGGADLIDAGASNDFLIGGAGDDLLIGGSGADSMDGGAGSDNFYVDNVGDVLIDAVAAGTDRVATTISYTLTADADIEVFEAITLGATDAMDLTGNGFGQTIVGNNGTNMIDGKGGADILAGLGGADTFAFTSALGGGNVDTVADFSAADDTIALDDAVFTGLAPGALAAGAFVIGSAAGDADDRIIYNSTTGALYFDADGNGAGAMVQFATLAGAPAITASDFTVI